MKSPFIKSDNSIKRYILNFYIAFIPLIIYGFYKNFNIYNTFFDGILKPFCLLLCGIISGILIEIIYQKLLLKKNRIDLESSFFVLYSLIVCMMMPANINFILLFLCLISGFLILKIFCTKIHISPIPIMYLLLLIVFNLYNMRGNGVQSLINLVMGNYSGGAFITSNILAVIGYFLLITNPIYKKDIPIYTFVIYMVLICIYSCVSNISIYNYIFTNMLIFSLIYIATDTKYCPYTFKGKIIYSTLIAIFSFILNVLLNLNFGVILAIFISQLITSCLKAIFIKKNGKNN